MAKDLKALLMDVDKLFPPSKDKFSTFNYTLGKFPQGWRFDVVNNWSAWYERKLTPQFGLYQEPEQAVLAFLIYVRKRKISVRSLCHE